MNVLIACEFSGVIRDAFRRKGHEAWSCDLEEIEPEGDYSNYHWYGDCRFLIEQQPYGFWDLMICHPPCTYLAVSGARWFKDRPKEQIKALEFVKYLLNCNIPKICLENPISIISSKIRKPDQIIQPWMFGHGETKATCLWLKNLTLLKPTNIVEGREAKVHKMSPGLNRGKDRSRTYKGIAEAMAKSMGINNLKMT